MCTVWHKVQGVLEFRSHIEPTGHQEGACVKGGRVSPSLWEYRYTGPLHHKAFLVILP